jgi:hypothetical protein
MFCQTLAMDNRTNHFISSKISIDNSSPEKLRSRPEKWEGLNTFLLLGTKAQISPFSPFHS